MIERMMQKVAVLATKAAQQEPLDGVRKTKFVILCRNHAMVEIIMDMMVNDLLMQKEGKNKLRMSGVLDGVKIDSRFYVHPITPNILHLRGHQFTGAAIDDRYMTCSLYGLVSERVGRYPFPDNGVGPTWYGVL